jgi:hypothetical protein
VPISFFRFKRESGSRDAAPAAFALPRRALIALGLGFACVATALATLAPAANSVLAAPDDSAASFWLSERRQSAPASDALRRQQAQQRHAQQQQARLQQQQQARLQQQRQAQFQQKQREAQQRAQLQAQYLYQQQVQAQMQQAPRRSHLSQIMDRMPWNRVVTITPNTFDLAPWIQRPEMSSNVAPADRRPAVRMSVAASPAPKPKPRPRALCVRLCDGSYFPVPGTGAGTQEDCNLACPRAPTRLYKTTNGDISTAVSAATGASYFALPVAMRFSKTLDQTCSCGTSDPMATILRDATLRRGDRVMTPEGFRVFKGGAKPPYSPRNFNSVDKALHLPRSERAILRSMERAAGVRPGAARRDAFAALLKPDIVGRPVSQ